MCKPIFEKLVIGFERAENIGYNLYILSWRNVQKYPLILGVVPIYHSDLDNNKLQVCPKKNMVCTEFWGLVW